MKWNTPWNTVIISVFDWLYGGLPDPVRKKSNKEKLKDNSNIWTGRSLLELQGLKNIELFCGTDLFNSNNNNYNNICYKRIII